MSAVGSAVWHGQPGLEPLQVRQDGVTHAHGQYQRAGTFVLLFHVCRAACNELRHTTAAASCVLSHLAEEAHCAPMPYPLSRP